jgi:aspartyl-tRNA(Asn)/glutamyl-tRNA(Gln) amidotransferase subunit A
MTAPHTLTLAEAAALIAARRLSPVELLEDCLARIAAVEPRLNAIIALLAEPARAAARDAEAEIAKAGPRSPLHGVPVGLKDIIDLAGIATTCHSKLQIDRIATEDAAAVTRLNAELVKALSSPEVKEKFQALSMVPTPGTAEQFGAMLQAEAARFVKAARAAGLKLE